ncbi:hypothetical protein [Hymenobacter koreensis]|uniref:hypothetical protein n=1 Tax=Hymenobacter koreensis TaxID=1084523 RepID=UPI0031E4E82A
MKTQELVAAIEEITGRSLRKIRPEVLPRVLGRTLSDEQKKWYVQVLGLKTLSRSRPTNDLLHRFDMLNATVEQQLEALLAALKLPNDESD